MAVPLVDPVLGVAAGGVVLVAAWLAATRRHVRRRERSAAEWTGTDGHTDLWTSAARCPVCGSRGGVLQVAGDGLEFVCLACGDRHARQHRG